MTLSNASQNAIRSAYARKIEEAVTKISNRSLAVLLYRIVEAHRIELADREDLLRAALIGDDDIQILFDFAEDLYGGFIRSVIED